MAGYGDGCTTGDDLGPGCIDRWAPFGVTDHSHLSELPPQLTLLPQRLWTLTHGLGFSLGVLLA